jgi:hypothetical protein
MFDESKEVRPTKSHALLYSVVYILKSTVRLRYVICRCKSSIVKTGVKVVKTYDNLYVIVNRLICVFQKFSFYGFQRIVLRTNHILFYDENSIPTCHAEIASKTYTMCSGVAMTENRS